MRRCRLRNMPTDFRLRRSAGLGLRLCPEPSKPLVRTQIPPLPHRQLPQHHPPDADALEPDHSQAYLLAHAPDLALLAFSEHEAQLLGVLPFHLRGLERLAIQAQPVAQARELRHGLSLD